MGAVRGLGLRLLLRDAVDAAPASKERPSIDEHDFATGIGLLQNLAGAFVSRIIEGTQDDGTIADVVVDVAEVHPIFVVLQHIRGRNGDDLELAG